MPPEDKDPSNKEEPSEQEAPATIDDLISHYVALGKSAMDDYAVLASNAGKRIAGDKDQPETSWADDVAKFWGLVARDQAMSMKLYTQLLAVATTGATKAPDK
jgi:hypothetical protein